MHDPTVIRELLRLHERNRAAYQRYSDCLFGDFSRDERERIGREAFSAEIDWMNAINAAGYRNLLDVLHAALTLDIAEAVPVLAGEERWHPEPPC